MGLMGKLWPWKVTLRMHGGEKKKATKHIIKGSI